MSSSTSGAALVADLSIRVTITGADALRAAMRDTMLTISHLAQPLIEEAESIRAASMEIVPIDQGDLKASAIAVGIQKEETAEGVKVIFGYGTNYAVVQHETPPDKFSHLPGKTWKYLERPTFDAITGMESRLADRLSILINNLGRR